MGAEHRSRNSVLKIVEKIERNENLNIDQSKGIIGRSLLFNIENFNFTYDVPAEYLHSGCLGTIKRLVELTFDVGTNRTRITTRKLSSTAKFNKLMLLTKVTHEFSRRARKLDFAVFKGQEYRNLILFFFPLVLECIEPDANENVLWLYLVFMLRSCILPSNEFSPISVQTINQCCENFYKLFEELFGPQNCSYNLHVICCHLLEIRTHGPLTETSAFKFESFYGEVRRSFVPGTTSTLKQVLKNFLLKRALSNHICTNNIHITNYDTPMECNSVIYCYKKKEYSFYKISDINEDIMTCHKIGKYTTTFNDNINLPWSSVGVFRKGGTSSETCAIKSSEISGKALNVGKYLITCPINVLKEK